MYLNFESLNKKGYFAYYKVLISSLFLFRVISCTKDTCEGDIAVFAGGKLSVTLQKIDAR